MQFDPERGAVDWDGLWTFGLTLLLLIIGLGLPLLISLRYIYRTALSADSETDTTSLLVFGKRLVNEQIDRDYRQRLDKVAALLKQDADRKLLLVGGTADSRQISEARAGQNHLIRQGIDSRRLTLEQQSQNTLENLRHARSLLEKAGNYPVALISNRYHLARIRTIAQSLGLEYRLCACEEAFEPSIGLMPRMIIEGMYVLWFNTGKAWSQLIRSQRMLSRIT
ncbi:MAG: YdcF family protein [Candidatus Thiodiazotropha sp. (ex Epidulcina cf. delphinae)]|nr:YdcF family protein [Candidatus Thiodiazotropha sp. (ex Epidulcina cf. delphinae)]